MIQHLFTAALAGLCAVLVLLVYTLLETALFSNIQRRDFLKKAVPLFLIVSIFSYIIL